MAPLASAQTPANVVVAQGNGQLICDRCSSRGGPFFYQQVYAVVTDANGNPIPNYPVTWTVTSGTGFVAGTTTQTTYTDGTGTTFVTPSTPTSYPLEQGYFVQFQFTATAGNVSSTFTETNGFADLFGNQVVGVNSSNSPVGSGTPLTGTAGSTTTPFTIQVYTTGGPPVPGVSVRLINDDGTSGPSATSPSAYCQTGPSGAYGTPDPYSVLTDATGTATCTPVFGPIGGGSHSVAIMVGGVPAGEWSIPGTAAGSLFNPAQIQYLPGTQMPLPAYFISGPINLSVKAAAVGSVSATSGNNQSATSGQALASPLVATVKDASGNLLAGQSVTWSASPSAAVTFSNQTTVTNASGQVSTNVIFTSSASGAVIIKATSVSNTAASASFTETAIPPIVVSSLSKVAGDSQSAIVGAPFATPLEVQVMVSSGSAVGVPVAFTTGGVPITLSANSATTNASGIAQVTATAGATPGNATVTATVGSASVTFNLVVVPQGPSITASNFVNGADLQRGSISPCSLGAIMANGLAPAVAGTLTGPLVGPLPYTLGGAMITFNSNDQAPIVSISSNLVIFEVPCDLSAGSVPVTVNISGATSTVNVNLLPASPGIFSSVQSDGASRAVIIRPDGSFATPANPARRGENVTVFVTGLGAVSPAVNTNAVPIPGTPSIPTGTVIVGINGEGTQVMSSQLAPDRQGFSEITFQIPQDAPQNNNVQMSIGVIPAGSSTEYYSAGAYLPIQ